MEITTMCLRGLGAGHWAGLRRNGVAEPVMRGLVKNIGGMRWPDEPLKSSNFQFRNLGIPQSINPSIIKFLNPPIRF